MSGFTSEKQFSEGGGFLLGSSTLTVKAEVEMAYHDRIVNRRSVINFSELVTKGDTTTDKTRFEIITPSLVLGKEGREYTLNTNYEIVDGKIHWVGTAPTEGDFYSIAYQTYPSWLVFSHLHLVRDTNIKFQQPAPVLNRLPIQVMCKLEYLWED
ncbi:MAG: hypothetical protein JEZ11_24590 [Desulfobacterales bacterium]|nr:hypothetical protein [Desulfobacterales bacterium]